MEQKFSLLVLQALIFSSVGVGSAIHRMFRKYADISPSSCLRSASSQWVMSLGVLPEQNFTEGLRYATLCLHKCARMLKSLVIT